MTSLAFRSSATARVGLYDEVDESFRKILGSYQNGTCVYTCVNLSLPRKQCAICPLLSYLTPDDGINLVRFWPLRWLFWFVCLDGFDVTINRKLEGAGTPHARYVSITAQVCKQLCEDIHRFVHCCYDVFVHIYICTCTCICTCNLALVQHMLFVSYMYIC